MMIAAVPELQLLISRSTVGRGSREEKVTGDISSRFSLNLGRVFSQRGGSPATPAKSAIQSN